MRLIYPTIEWLWHTFHAARRVEEAGRTCYKSESGEDADAFVRMLIKRGHEAMIEHASMSYKVVCDRGVTHEIVRHRLFSYAQESTRYCNYKGGVQFIIPPWFREDFERLQQEGIFNAAGYLIPTYEEGMLKHLRGSFARWVRCLRQCEVTYIELLNYGQTPQEARSVLPNALKTEIVITGNMREWRHFFKLRTAKTAHPQMQEVANMLLDYASANEVFFEDIKENRNEDK